jgi:hypothetical protein
MNEHQLELRESNNQVFGSGPLRPLVRGAKVENVDNKSNGFTIAWIFQDSRLEFERIIAHILSLKLDSSKQENLEIILCGPFNHEFLVNSDAFSLGNYLKFLDYDISGTSISDYIGLKKNHIIRNCRFNKLAILHSRIEITHDFIMHYMADDDFELSTPTVMCRMNDKYLPYLDLIFLKNYDLVKNNNNYLWGFESNFMIKFIRIFSEVYIDGGCFVINLKKVPNLMMSEYHRWGYAEDVNFCWRAHLMDYKIKKESIKIYSTTNKLKIYEKGIFRNRLILNVYKIFCLFRFLLKPQV